ncbi:MAG TPA: hypothetical protein VHG92_08000 [Afifellaceae bacterium]|nr:hypothetical protein [Afifellaceae bacterium]
MADEKKRILAREEIKELLRNAQALEPGFRAKLSAPFVVSLPPEWDSAKHRVVIVGQETGGWGYSRNGDWRDRLDDCLTEDGVLESLATNDEEFDFARGDSSFERTPFWRAHRELAGALEDGDYRRVLWLNLVRTDFNKEGTKSANMWWNLSWPEAEAIAEWQKHALPAEMLESEAKAAVFFTGPNYDFYLKAAFPGIQFNQLRPDHGPRVLARLVHEALPRCAVRTYHPNYLRRSGQWQILTRIIEQIRAEAA